MKNMLEDGYLILYNTFSGQIAENVDETQPVGEIKINITYLLRFIVIEPSQSTKTTNINVIIEYNFKHNETTMFYNNK